MNTGKLEWSALGVVSSLNHRLYSRGGHFNPKTWRCLK